MIGKSGREVSRSSNLYGTDFGTALPQNCPDGEMDIIPRFERDVAGSTPARGTDKRKGYPIRLTGPGWKPDEPHGLAGSTPAPSADRWCLWCNGPHATL